MQAGQERVKEIDRSIAKMGLYDLPGTILVGLGLYGKFGANGDAFLPVLNNPDVINGFLVVGVAIMLLCGIKVFGLMREKKRLLKMT